MTSDHLQANLKNFSVSHSYGSVSVRHTGRSLRWEQGFTSVAQRWPQRETSRIGTGTLCIVGISYFSIAVIKHDGSRKEEFIWTNGSRGVGVLRGEEA